LFPVDTDLKLDELMNPKESDGILPKTDAAKENINP